MCKSGPPLVGRRLSQDHRSLTTRLQILQNFVAGRRGNADETSFIECANDAVARPALTVDNQDGMQHPNEDCNCPTLPMIPRHAKFPMYRYISDL
jgi:hypothetical protein